MSTSPIILILGAGPRVGAATASKFAANGYRVAVSSRKGTGSKTPEGYLSVAADLSKPETVSGAFAAVRSEFGSAPSVVVYNAAALTPPPVGDSALSIPVEAITADLNVNTVSPFAAAQLAVAGWEEEGVDKSVKKSFIYTGNILNLQVPPVAVFTTLGMGKAASAFWIGVADGTYSAKGYRFFYADERQEDGKSKGADITGPAHADFFEQLANHEAGVPWQATFVKGKGYVKFE